MTAILKFIHISTKFTLLNNYVSKEILEASNVVSPVFTALVKDSKINFIPKKATRWCRGSRLKQTLRGKFRVIQAYPKMKRISNKQPNLTSTRTRGTTTNKAQSEYQEGNNQDQSRIK